MLHMNRPGAVLHLITGLYSLIAPVVSDISLKQWSCGVTDHIADKSYNLFTGACEAYKPQVNYCCAEHKDCYKLQLGEHYCNVRLCVCLQKIIEQRKKNDTCAYPIYRSCTDARMHGEELYKKYNKTSYEYGCNAAGSIENACQVNHHECLKKNNKDHCDKYLSDCQTCATQQCQVKLERDKVLRMKGVAPIIWNPVILLALYSAKYVLLD
ncbi:hypothetical protein GCK32_001593 [Trichostrongylus colubriformis]|uniref:Uncharacterized protein n=1 Tax=Trichostrongylus colubriformis TaxID=6319 RepID=A0AAN8IVI3_TRICO